MAETHYPHTPDGRYFVAKARLWRCSDPALAADERRRLVRCLMQARREVGAANGTAETRAARARVHDAKVALGERGAVWWHDSAPDETGKHPNNTRYAAWWRNLASGDGSE